MTDTEVTETEQYEVSFDAFQHVVVEVEDEDGARREARKKLRAHGWDISDTRVNGPY